MDLKDISDQELNKMLENSRNEITRLSKLINEEKQEFEKASFELQSRHKWNTHKIQNLMYKQLEEYEDKIEEYSFYVLKKIVDNLSSNLKKNHYLVSNIYFDFSEIVANKLNNFELICKRARYHKPIYGFKFNFDEKKDKINRIYVCNIFKIDNKRKPFKFLVSDEKVKEINKISTENVTKISRASYNKFEDIIPDMVKVIQFIEQDFVAVLLSYEMNM